MQAPRRQRTIKSSKPTVALTFDDGPGIYTSQILDTLQQYGGHVSFFVTGSKVEEGKSKILRALHMGCEVICHAWDHPDYTELSRRAIKKELINTITAIAKVTGTVSPMFRPPYGHTNKRVEKLAKYLGLAMVNWSLSPEDWKIQDAEVIYSHIISNLKDGDIVLCHDVYETTAKAMSRLIPELISRNYELITVTELLTRKYGKIEPGKLYLN